MELKEEIEWGKCQQKYLQEERDINKNRRAQIGWEGEVKGKRKEERIIERRNKRERWKGRE